MFKQGMMAVLVASMALAASPQAFAFAQQKAAGAELVVGEASLLEAQAQKVRDGFADGGIYAETSAGDRAKVLAALDRMETTMGGHTDVRSLDADQRASLMNDQSLVNTILTKARADSRMVCKRERSVGSRMTKTNCLTVAERRRLHDESRQFVESEFIQSIHAPNP